jgi:PAS domain S-box-containing protein
MNDSNSPLLPHGGYEHLHGGFTERLHAARVLASDGSDASDTSDPSDLAHDLNVHQIELEMQNEELLRTQAELDTARARYFDLYDLAPVGYVTVGETGLIQEANLTAANLLGVPRGTLIQCPLSRFMIREDADRFYLLCKQLLDAGEPQSCDLRMVKGDGTPFWAHLVAITSLDADGVPECRVTLTDITERKRMENKLAEEAVRRRILIEQSRDGIVVLDPECKVFEANRRYAEMLGYTPEELLQLHVWDWDTQWTREELLGQVGSVDSAGARFETRHRRKDGSFRDVEICSNGALCGGRRLVFCVCRDITERKLAEAYRAMGPDILTVLNEAGTLRQALQRVVSLLKAQTGFDAVGIRLQDGDDFPYYAQQGFSEDFLRTENTLASRGTDGVVCLDKDGNIRLACTCGLVVSGKTDPAHPLFTRGGSFWTNDSFPLLDLPAHQDPRLNPRNQCMHVGYASMGLIPIRNKDRIVGLLQLNDRRKGCFSLATVEILEDLASHIGAALMNKRAEEELLKMQKLQSIGTLAGGIAHDFNNILLGLFGNISLAKDELAENHPAHALLAEAERSMNRAVRLTKQLLTFAKGGDPVKENVGLGALVEEVARFDLSGSNVIPVCRQADNLWPVLADKGQIQQVVSNLVINARQAMPAGGHLHINLENASLAAEDVTGLRQGSYVKVTVRDEGTGIEPTFLARIFDPYFTTKQSGSGLGLATAWSIITKHGGHIGAVSEVGKGTTFTFYLPASETGQRAAAKPPAETSAPIAVRAAKILIMDDEDSVCRLVQSMLARCGYTVATAPGGQEAIALYRQALDAGEPFDAVILDLTIPGGIGGIEALRDLLALDPTVRAIVSSGYAGDPVMANPASYGFKGTVAKPYTARALREVVARVLA